MKDKEEYEDKIIMSELLLNIIKKFSILILLIYSLISITQLTTHPISHLIYRCEKPNKWPFNYYNDYYNIIKYKYS
jgi:uncharacterized protein YggT (Ycf19 family)